MPSACSLALKQVPCPCLAPCLQAGSLRSASPLPRLAAAPCHLLSTRCTLVPDAIRLTSRGAQKWFSNWDKEVSHQVVAPAVPPPLLGALLSQTPPSRHPRRGPSTGPLAREALPWPSPQRDPSNGPPLERPFQTPPPREALPNAPSPDTPQVTVPRRGPSKAPSLAAPADDPLPDVLPRGRSPRHPRGRLGGPGLT